MSGEDRDPENRDWQRLDRWLWCARVMKQRSDCARLVESGRLRINRQVTDKPHARLRVGDVLTLASAREVRVMVVEALAARRGPPAEARRLYRDIHETASPPEASATPVGGCDDRHSAAYPASVPTAARPVSRSA